MFLRLARFLRNNWFEVLLVLFVSVQVLYLALGSLENSWLFSSYEDEYALQGKDPSSSHLNLDPKLAGKQNMQAGSFAGTGGIPVAFGENAPDVLPARAGVPRNLQEGEADHSVSAPKLLIAQLGDVGPVPGSDGGNGMPGAEGAGGVPGPEGRGGLPGLEGGGGIPGLEGRGGMPGPEGGDGKSVASQRQSQGSGGTLAVNKIGMNASKGSGVKAPSSVNSYSLSSDASVGRAHPGNSSVRANDAQRDEGKPVKASVPKSAWVVGKPQKLMNTVDSGTSYGRGLRIIYYLEARGGKYSLNRSQAAYLLRLINEVEDISQHGDPVPSVEPVLVAAQPQNVGNLLTWHEAKKHEARKHEARKHEARKHEARKHEARKHEAKKHEDRKHEDRKHEDRKHEKKVLGKGNDDGADSYRTAFLIMYALEAKGGNYALTPKQAQILLNMIDDAESLKSVVPDAQSSLPRILTAEQLSYIRSSLSAAAAEGKRTDPTLLNSYAAEVLELTK